MPERLALLSPASAGARKFQIFLVRLRLLQSLVNHELSDFLISHLQDFAQDIVVVLPNFRTAPRRGGRRTRKTHPRSLDWYCAQPRMFQVGDMSAN